MSYYHSILTRSYLSNPSLVIDESLFRSLLLALVAQKNVIIRTTATEEQRQLTQIVNVLHSLFSQSVVKLRLRQSDNLTPDEFLRLLFLENPAHGQTTSRTSSRKTLNAGGNHAFAFRRSSSYPNPSSTDDTAYEADSLYGGPLKDGSERNAQSPLPGERQSLLRAQTDPMPLWHEDKLGSNLIPQVLVVSGLEYISEEVQSAFWTALSKRQISLGRGHQNQRANQKNSISDGVWPLPSDFIVVYVCPIGNGYDRPRVHKSLVDRFALSIEVSELAFDNRMPPVSPKETEAALPRSVLSQMELADLRVLADPAHTIIGSRVDLYLSDLLSAVRHHPQLDGMLITARCHAETVHLLRAWRALFGRPVDSTGRAPLSLDVTDDDVRKVFFKAVQHRVGVLEGPRQEIMASLIFTAAGDPGENEEWESGRKTVKEVLKEILDVV